MPRAALGFCLANRAENLWQLSHGQKLLPQFRKIVGLEFLSGKIQKFFLVMLSLPKHPAVRRILFSLFTTLDSSTTLLATAMLLHRTYGFAFFKGVATWIHTLRTPCKQVAPLCIDRMTIGWDTHTRIGIIGNMQNYPCHSERKRRISWKRNGTIYTSFYIIPLPRDCHAEQVGSQWQHNNMEEFEKTTLLFDGSIRIKNKKGAVICRCSKLL